jgi:hypothetical protein
MLLNSILKSAERFRASKENPLFIAVDSRSWRKDWFKENMPPGYPTMKSEGYKGDRGDKSDVWTKVYEVYHGIMEDIRKHSDFHVIKVPGAEGDDIVAVVVKMYPDQDSVVVSSDKDFQQLQGERVRIFDPFTGDFKTVIDTEKFKKIHILKAGDDNIANISKGKNVEKLLSGLDRLLATDQVFRANFEFNRALIDFDYIPAEVVSSIEDAVRACTFNYSCMELLTVFSKFRLAQMAEKVGRFRLPDAAQPQQPKASDAVKRAIQGSLEDFF